MTFTNVNSIAEPRELAAERFADPIQEKVRLNAKVTRLGWRDIENLYYSAGIVRRRLEANTK
jgi:hypothetical protein